jgi:hypothetical protein
MAKLEICIYCKKPIGPADDYVSLPPAPSPESGKFGEVQYEQSAHAKCHEKFVATTEPS